MPGASNRVKTVILESMNSDLARLVSQLDAFATDCLSSEQGQITRNIKRTKWIRGKGKVQQLLVRARDIRSRLQLELNTIAIWNERYVRIVMIHLVSGIFN